MTKHDVELVVTEVHEYNLTPIFQAGPTPYGGHQMLAGSTDAKLLCIHMQRTDKSPVEPNLPEEARVVLKSLQAMPGFPGGNMLHVTASATIVISPEEYDKMGRPRAHEKVRVTFEYEGQ